jgi:hypothetical protein
MQREAAAGMKSLEAEGQQYKAAIPSFRDVTGPYTAAQLATGFLSENVINLGLSVIGGITGAVVSKAVGKKMLEKAAFDAARDVLRDRGAIAGASLANWGMETGGIAQDQMELNKQIDPLRAIFGGALAAAVDTVGDAYLAKKFGLISGEKLVGKSRLASAGKGAIVGAITEGPTEGLQTIIEAASVPGKDMSTDAFKDEVINSIIAGTLMGKVVGGAGGALSYSAPQQTPPPAANVPPTPEAVTPPVPSVATPVATPSLTGTAPTQPPGALDEDVAAMELISKMNETEKTKKYPSAFSLEAHIDNIDKGDVIVNESGKYTIQAINPDGSVTVQAEPVSKKPTLDDYGIDTKTLTPKKQLDLSELRKRMANEMDAVTRETYKPVSGPLSEQDRGILEQNIRNNIMQKFTSFATKMGITGDEFNAAMQIVIDSTKPRKLTAEPPFVTRLYDENQTPLFSLTEQKERKSLQTAPVLTDHDIKALDPQSDMELVNIIQGFIDKGYNVQKVLDKAARGIEKKSFFTDEVLLRIKEQKKRKLAMPDRVAKEAPTDTKQLIKDRVLMYKGPYINAQIDEGQFDYEFLNDSKREEPDKAPIRSVPVGAITNQGNLSPEQREAYAANPSSPEALNAALSHPDFVAWLDQVKSRRTNYTVRYDEETGNYRLAKITQKLKGEGAKVGLTDKEIIAKIREEFPDAKASDISAAIKEASATPRATRELTEEEKAARVSADEKLLSDVYASINTGGGFRASGFAEYVKLYASEASAAAQRRQTTGRVPISKTVSESSQEKMDNELIRTMMPENIKGLIERLESNEELVSEREIAMLGPVIEGMVKTPLGRSMMEAFVKYGKDGLIAFKPVPAPEKKTKKSAKEEGFGLELVRKMASFYNSLGKKQGRKGGVVKFGTSIEAMKTAVVGAKLKNKKGNVIGAAEFDSIKRWFIDTVRKDREARGIVDEKPPQKVLGKGANKVKTEEKKVETKPEEKVAPVATKEKVKGDISKLQAANKARRDRIIAVQALSNQLKKPIKISGKSTMKALDKIEAEIKAKLEKEGKKPPEPPKKPPKKTPPKKGGPTGGGSTGGVTPVGYDETVHETLSPEDFKAEAINWESEAKKHNVIFNGMQERLKKPPIPLFTHPTLKTTFTVNDGETLQQAIDRKFAEQKAAESKEAIAHGVQEEGKQEKGEVVVAKKPELIDTKESAQDYLDKEYPGRRVASMVYDLSVPREKTMFQSAKKAFKSTVEAYQLPSGKMVFASLSQGELAKPDPVADKALNDVRSAVDAFAKLSANPVITRGRPEQRIVKDHIISALKKMFVRDEAGLSNALKLIAPNGAFPKTLGELQEKFKQIETALKGDNVVSIKDLASEDIAEMISVETPSIIETSTEERDVGVGESKYKDKESKIVNKETDAWKEKVRKELKKTGAEAWSKYLDTEEMLSKELQKKNGHEIFLYLTKRASQLAERLSALRKVTTDNELKQSLGVLVKDYRKFAQINPFRIDTRNDEVKALIDKLSRNVDLTGKGGISRDRLHGKPSQYDMLMDYIGKVRSYANHAINLDPNYAKMKQYYKSLGANDETVQQLVWDHVTPYTFFKNPKLMKQVIEKLGSNETLNLGSNWLVKGIFDKRNNRINRHYLMKISPEFYATEFKSGEYVRLPNKMATVRYPAYGIAVAIPKEITTSTTINGKTETKTSAETEIKVFEVVKIADAYYLEVLEDQFTSPNTKQMVAKYFVDKQFTEKIGVTNPEDMLSVGKLETEETTELTVEKLQTAIPGAKVESTGKDTFTVMFNNGFGFTIKNETIGSYTKNGETFDIKGQWSVKDGDPLIRLSKLGTSEMVDQTLHHELFHMVADIFMSKEEQSFFLQRYGKAGTDIKSAWEAAADAYMNWDGKTADTFFQKIMQFARQLLYMLRNLTFKVDPKITESQLFNQIRTGQIYKRTPFLNFFQVKDAKITMQVRDRTMPKLVYENGMPHVQDLHLDKKQSWANFTTDEGFNSLIRLSNEKDAAAWLPNHFGLFDYVINLFKSKEALKRGIESGTYSGYEVSRWEHVLSLPVWKAMRRIYDDKSGKFVAKYPSWGRAVGIEKDRFHGLKSKMSQYLESTGTAHRLNRDEQKVFDKLVVETMDRRKYYTKKEMLDKGISEKIAVGYLEMANHLKNVMLPAIFKNSEKAILKPYLSSSAYTTDDIHKLKLLYGRLHDLDTADTDYTNKWNKVVADGNETFKDNKEMLKVFKKVQDRLSEMRYLRNQIGAQPGYFPAKRKTGKFYVATERTYKDEEGNTIKEIVARVAAKNAGEAESIKAAMEADPDMQNNDKETFRTFAGRNSNLLESSYFMIGDLNTQRVIDNALAKLRHDKTLSADQADELSQAVLENIADSMKARGAASSSIARNVLKWEKHAFAKGYMEEDFVKIIDSYTSGYYGMHTKFDAAMQYVDVIREIPNDQAQTHEDISKYARDMLRNSDRYDYAIHKLKGFAFGFFLVGKLSMSILQFTQNFVTAVPTLAMHMNEWKVNDRIFRAEGVITKALFDIATNAYADRKSLTQDELEMLADMKEMGETLSQFYKELEIEASMGFGKFAKKAIQLASLPFSGMETFNRMAAALSVYRVLKQKGGYTKEQIYKEIEQFIDKTHYWMGRGNSPSWTTGDDMFAKTANLSYTFRRFQHNYAISLVAAFQNYGGKEGLLFAARSFAWLTIFGGIAALPFLDDFIEMAEKITKRPIRTEVRKMISDNYSKAAASWYHAGPIGSMLGDMSAAIRPLSLPTLEPDKLGASAFGVWGSMLLKKPADAYSFFKMGDSYRAFESLAPSAVENMFKAYRLHEEGYKTKTGKIIYGPDGLPMKIQSHVREVLQGMGFRPVDEAIAQQDLRIEDVLIQRFNKQREQLNAKMRNAETQEEKTTVAREITKFNLDIPDYMRGVISPVRFGVAEKPTKRHIIYSGNVQR